MSVTEKDIHKVIYPIHSQKGGRLDALVLRGNFLELEKVIFVLKRKKVRHLQGIYSSNKN